jgi:hypothetical protein
VRELTTEIEFEGTPEEAWEVLTDLPAHAEWNPFITSFEGELRPGARLTVRMQPEGGRAMTFRPCAVVVEAPHELRWLGHLGVPMIFDGEHRFRIDEVRPGRVRFVQSERFRGAMVPVLWRRLQDGTAKGFRAMNEALARRVTARRQAAAP